MACPSLTSRPASPSRSRGSPHPGRAVPPAARRCRSRRSRRPTATPCWPACAPGHPPAVADLPDHQVVRQKAVQDTSLNSASRRSSRATGGRSPPARRGSFGPWLDPRVPAGGRVGAGRPHGPVSLLGQRGPDLLAADPPAPVGPLARVSARPGRARARLAEQLAPGSPAAASRAGSAPAGRRCRTGQRRAPPTRRSRVMRGQPAARISSRSRAARAGWRPPPGPGQVRQHPAAGGQPAVRSRPSSSPISASSPDLGAEFGIAFGQLDPGGPERSRHGERGHPLAPPARRPEQGAQRQRPPVVQVSLVLPGVADAAEGLDAVVRRVDRAVDGDYGGHGRGSRGRRPARFARHPRRRPRPFRAGRASGAAVLDRLELADRAAELVLAWRTRSRCALPSRRSRTPRRRTGWRPGWLRRRGRTAQDPLRGTARPSARTLAIGLVRSTADAAVTSRAEASRATQVSPPGTATPATSRRPSTRPHGP